MAKKYSIDDLNRLLEGQKAAISKIQEEENPYTKDNPKNLDTIFVEDTPLVEKKEPIAPFDIKKSNLEEFSRSNYNPLIEYQYEVGEKLNKRSAEDESAAKSADDILVKYIRNLAQKANSPFEIKERENKVSAQDLQNRVSAQLSELEKPAEQVSEKEKMLYGLGPAVLALLTGGGAASAQAGMAAQKVGMDELEGLHKARLDERKARIDSVGKQLQGVGEIQKGEAEKDKMNLLSQEKAFEMNQKVQDKLGEYIKFLADKRMKADENSLAKFLDYDKNTSKTMESGIKSSVDVINKEEDRAAGLQKAKLGAQAAANRQSERPLTESQAKFTMQYNNMRNANNQYGAIVGEDGMKSKSLTNDWFRTLKQLSNETGATPIADFTNKYFTDPQARREVQSEIAFLQSVGRIQSGAAITPAEWVNFRSEFFPNAGDTRETVAQKKRARESMLQGTQVGAGKGIEKLPPPQQVVPEYLPEPDVQEYADQHGLDYDTALKYLQKIGIK